MEVGKQVFESLSDVDQNMHRLIISETSIKGYDDVTIIRSVEEASSNIWLFIRLCYRNKL